MFKSIIVLDYHIIITRNKSDQNVFKKNKLSYQKYEYYKIEKLHFKASQIIVDISKP